MNLLARNWAQVKYSKQVFAIGHIVNPGEKVDKYYCKSKYQSVSGGTGWAVQMAIDNMKDVWVFDQLKTKWYHWSYSSMSFIESKEEPKITLQDFAGIGTRQINQHGISAIEGLYKKTFNK